MPGRCKSHDEVILPYPPERVWRALADLRAWPVWWPISVELRVLAMQPGLTGSRIEISPRGGVRFECRIAQVVQPQQIHIDYAAGLFVGHGVWRLEAIEHSATRLSYTVDLHLRNRVLAMLLVFADLRAIHVRLMRNVFQGLRDHLERQPVRLAARLEPALRASL